MISKIAPVTNIDMPTLSHPAIFVTSPVTNGVRWSIMLFVFYELLEIAGSLSGVSHDFLTHFGHFR
jgi:hypothetical protein